MRPAFVAAASLAALCLILSCAPSPVGPDDEYKVYNAFLASRFAEKMDPLLLYKEAGVFFIYGPDHYFDQRSADYIDGFFRERGKLVLDRALIVDFIAKNETPAPIEAARIEHRTLLQDAFRKKDVYILSRVGFGPSGREALLYASFSSNAEFGHGNFIILRKNLLGAWKAARSVAVWIYD